MPYTSLKPGHKTLDFNDIYEKCDFLNQQIENKTKQDYMKTIVERDQFIQILIKKIQLSKIMKIA